MFNKALKSHLAQVALLWLRLHRILLRFSSGVTADMVTTHLSDVFVRVQLF